MNKILSIVVPTYNMERYLTSAITSLFVSAPLFSLLDIIIVNDGSTDNSLSIAQDFARQHPDVIRVISKTNGNYGSCINSALKVATGKYIKILDADDSFSTTALSAFINHLTTEKADLVLTNYCIINQRGKRIKSMHIPIKPSPHNELTHTQLAAVANIMSMHNVCYRTAILQQIGYEQTEGISYTDMEWIFMPMSAVNSIKYYKLELYKYLLGRSEQTVDEQIHLRKMGDEEVSIMKNIAQLQSLHPSNAAYNYLTLRIFQRLRSVYHGTLAQPPTNTFNLKAFEDKLKSTGFDFEECTNNMSINCIFFNYHLIQNWRKTYNQIVLQQTIGYKIYHFIRSARNAYNNFCYKYL